MKGIVCRFSCVGLLAVAAGCGGDDGASLSEGSVRTRGVLCLTFDDCDVDGWTQALPLFAAYDAHASFFLYGQRTTNELMRLKELVDAGHTLGIHTIHHRDAPKGFDELGPQGYGLTEIAPMVSLFSAVGLPVRHMAYPNNRRTPETDAFLAATYGLQRFRAGVAGCSRYNTNGTSIVTLDSAFFPVSDLPRRRVLGGVGVGEYYQTDISDICRGIRRAAERDEVFVIFSHAISPEAKGVSMKTAWLEEILRTAKTCGIAVKGFDELGPLDF